MIECLSSRRFVFARRAAVLAIASCALALGASAQQAASASANSAPLLASISSRPMDLATLAGVGYSSSSSSSSDDTAQPADPANLFDSTVTGLQPPPRRRYGRPRYNDSSHNSDGSAKWTGQIGVGFELPIGDTYRYYNTGWAFGGGFGRQWSKKFAVLAQFDYDHFGINKNTLDSQAALYNGASTGCGPGQGESGCALPVDGSNHVWSFTLNPKYTFADGDKYGAYVVGGFGFYHKVTDFTTPETGCYYYFGYCEPITENAVIDHYTSNAPGVNGGLGLTYKFSRFADERFFIEARYVVVLNSQREGYIYANNTNGYAPTGPNPDPNDSFPANSNRTTYVPIKIGLRF
jgi:hypothetical protein